MSIKQIEYLREQGNSGGVHDVIDSAVPLMEQLMVK